MHKQRKRGSRQNDKKKVAASHQRHKGTIMASGNKK